MTKCFSRAAQPVLTGFLVLVTVTVARADFIAVPIALQNMEGNYSNAFPFNTGTLPSQRYQQVYGASDFGSVDVLLITALAFRPEIKTQPPFLVTLPDIQINLSTTTRQPDDLSPLFVSNLGADDTVVFARGSLSLSSAVIGPAQGPKDFDALINCKIHSSIILPRAICCSTSETFRVANSVSRWTLKRLTATAFRACLRTVRYQGVWTLPWALRMR